MSGLGFDSRLQKVVIRGGIRAGLAPLGLNDSITTTRLVGSPETDWSDWRGGLPLGLGSSALGLRVTVPAGFFQLPLETPILCMKGVQPL